MVKSLEQLKAMDDEELLYHFGATCMRYLGNEAPQSYFDQVKEIILQKMSGSKEKDPASQAESA